MSLKPLDKKELTVEQELARQVPVDIKTVLDVGCGTTGKVRQIVGGKPTVVGIDVDPRAVGAGGRYGCAVLLVDMRRMEQAFTPDSFDLVLLKDSLEHVPKVDADDVVRQAKVIASKMILAYVPIGNYGDFPRDKGPHKHQYHWQPDELAALGFRIEKILNQGRSMIGVWYKGGE